MQIKRQLLAIGIATALFDAHAATITVNTNSDLTFFGGTRCTLRTAVEAADTDTALAGCAEGDGVDRIVFDPALNDSTITLQQGLIPIESSLTIDGAVGLRGGVTVSGDNANRIFLISDHVNAIQQNVTLRNLTVQDGMDTSGGAIFTAENLTLEQCEVSFNQANDSGALAQGINSTVTVRNSQISNNTSQFSAGAIEVLNTLVIEDSQLLGNSAGGDGGAIVSQFETSVLSITDSIIDGNSAVLSGGGIFAAGSTTIEQSTLSNNVAGSGGGLFLFPDASLVFTSSDLAPMPPPMVRVAACNPRPRPSL